MSYIYSYPKIAVVILVILLTIGCSGGSDTNPVTPVQTPDIPVESPRESVSDEGTESNRMLWGLWKVDIDPADMSVTAIPLRNIEAHYNITDYVLPPNCDDCLEFAVMGFNPTTRIMDVDVTLRNAMPITGKDIRGIIYTTDYGHDLTNSDGRTSLWDIPGGDTINPFKAFAKGVANRAFLPDAEHVENYLLYIPKPPHYNAIKFAIDTSWPGNCKEPYGISNFNQDGLLYELTGSSVDISVDVFDWQDNIAEVTIDVSEITGEPLTHMALDSGDTWTVNITNNTGAAAGNYKVKLTASAFDAGISLYEYATIVITDTPPPIVTGIVPDICFKEILLTGATISGSHFQGPGAEVKMEKDGWFLDISSVVVVDANTITCNVFAPYGFALGLYDIEVKNPSGLTGIGLDLFEVSVLYPEVVSIEPDEGSFGDPIVGATITGNNLQGPTAHVNLKMEGETDIAATNVSVEDLNTIICDIDIPLGTTLGLWDVEVINGTGVGDIGEELFEIYAPVPSDPQNVTPGRLNISPRGICCHEGYAYVAGYTNELNVFDISDPINPEWVHRVDLDGNVGNAVFVTGNYAYVGCGSAGMYIVDITDPESAYTVKTVDMFRADRMFVAGGYAYVASWYKYLYIVDVDPVADAYVVNDVEFVHNVRDVVCEAGYAYVANWAGGLQIVDVDPPESAEIVKELILDRAYGIKKVGDYVYVGNQQSGFSIIDVNPIDDTWIVKTVDTPGDANWVAVSGGYAYVTDDEESLQVIDIDPPGDASIVTALDTPGRAMDVAYYNGYVYVADESEGLFVVNAQTPESAYIENTVITPCGAQGVTIVGDYAYVAQYNSGLHILDVGYPPDAEDLWYYEIDGTQMRSIAQSAGILYVGDEVKLNILGLTLPDDLSVITTVPTSGRVGHVFYADGYVYTVCFEGGFDIIDVDPPESACVAKTVPTEYSTSVAINDGYAYLRVWSQGLLIIDIDPVIEASIINTVSYPSGGSAVAYADGHVYCANGYDGLSVVDVDPPESAEIVKTIESDGYLQDVAVSGGYAYVVSGEEGLQAFDIDPLDTAFLVGHAWLPNADASISLTLLDNYAYVTSGRAGVQIIKLY